MCLVCEVLCMCARACVAALRTTPLRRAYIHFISFHFISFHFISFNFISFHFISFHFISFHFTCRHKATAPQARHVHETAYVSRYAACTVVRVCTVRSMRVCACGVWAHFFAQGEMTRPSASSGAHRPHTSLREAWPTLATRPPCCGAPVPGWGFTGIRERLCSAAGPSHSQQRTAKGGKTLPKGPQIRSRNLSFRTTRPPQHSKLESSMRHRAPSWNKKTVLPCTEIALTEQVEVLVEHV